MDCDRDEVKDPSKAQRANDFAYSRQPDLSALGIPCTVVPVPLPRMRFPDVQDEDDADDLAYREWHLLTQGEDGSGCSVLGSLIRQTEGRRWRSADNTRRRVFFAFSGGMLGAMMGASMPQGPWCGALVSWCGYVDPEVCLQRHEASQGTLATILQHLNFARLASNLGHADSTQGDGCVVAGWRRNNAPLRKSERFPEEGWGFLDAEDFESEEVPSRCERVLMVAVASDDEEGFGCRLRDACGLASRLRSEASHVVGMATTSQAAECAVVACPGVLHGWHGFVDSHLANVGRWIARRTRSTPGYG